MPLQGCDELIANAHSRVAAAQQRRVLCASSICTVCVTMGQYSVREIDVVLTWADVGAPPSLE
jgi:hypothetical protein